MHFAFIPYGKRDFVERFLREIEAQKGILNMTKGEEKKGFWIDFQVRLLPGGIVDIIFPREDRDKVLNTMFQDQGENKDRYNLDRNISILGFKFNPIEKLRNFIGYSEIPKDYDKSKIYLWYKENINIIPIGLKEDVDMEFNDETKEDFGWTHEAI